MMNSSSEPNVVSHLIEAHNEYRRCWVSGLCLFNDYSYQQGFDTMLNFLQDKQ